MREKKQAGPLRGGSLRDSNGGPPQSPQALWGEDATSGAHCDDIWNEYQKGLDYLNADGYYSRVEECFRMVEGDQWHGLKSGDERPAQLNILQPIMKNSTALVGQNTMSIRYSSMNFDGDETQRARRAKLCERLNCFAAKTWERVKLDRFQWDILQDAFVGGDSFAWFYDGGDELKMELLDCTNIMFGDENNPVIQEQPYLLIIQRRYVDQVRREARENGLTEEEIGRIVSDDDTTGELLGQREVANDRKLISVMKLWKQDGEVWFARATKSVLYQPATRIEGLTLYPIAQYSWKPKKGSARGAGDIWDKIPNQISINKNLYRFESSVKASAFPHKVYQEGALSPDDVRKLSYPDSNIAVRDMTGQGVEKVVSYLQPANISPYAKDIWQELAQLTRELSGAGDNLENINPENASGAAINAARDAKTLNVNSQVTAFRQWVEDVALIWYDMWLAYNPNGVPVVWDEDGQVVMELLPVEELREMRLDVRVDVSPNNPYSKLAHESGLTELFTAGAITFEEYVEALDDDASIPKEKLKEIIQKRGERQKELQMMAALAQENEALKAQAQQGATAQQKLIELTQAMQAPAGRQTPAGQVTGVTAIGTPQLAQGAASQMPVQMGTTGGVVNEPVL